MIDRIFFEQSNLYVDWQLSDICNYKCHYCNFESKGGKNPWPELDEAIRLVNEILRNSKHEYRTYNLLGGEPTLWRYYGELCKYIKSVDDNCVIQTLTNGSRTLRWWQTFAPFMDKIVISHHSASSSAEHTSDVIKICSSHCSVSVQVLMDATNFDECVEHFDYLMRNNVGSRIVAKKAETMLGSGKWMEYSTSQQEWLMQSLIRTKENEDQPNQYDRMKSVIDRKVMVADADRSWQSSNKEIILNNWNHFKGWRCNIGIDMLSIRPNGDIKPSSACFNEIVLGNFKKPDFILELSTNGYGCKYDSCFCGADIEVEKYKQ